MKLISKAQRKRAEEAVFQAKLILLTSETPLEIEGAHGQGRHDTPNVFYMGSTTANRPDPFWYEHRGGRTYKQTPEEVVRAILPHVGVEAIEKAVQRHKLTQVRRSR